jgi:hypothetical protein
MDLFMSSILPSGRDLKFRRESISPILTGLCILQNHAACISQLQNASRMASQYFAEYLVAKNFPGDPLYRV